MKILVLGVINGSGDLNSSRWLAYWLLIERSSHRPGTTINILSDTSFLA